MADTTNPDAPKTVSRRAALKTFGAGVGAFAALPALSVGRGRGARHHSADAGGAEAARVHAAAQYATVDALTDTIIPTDERSPGAKAARVADYIDLLLSESDAATKQAWTGGVAALDAAATERLRAPFVKLTAVQRIELLTEISRNELAPQTPVEQFFRAAKDATIRGYYTSEIGIHKDLQYKGNQMLGEFVGCTHPEHGYPVVK